MSQKEISLTRRRLILVIPAAAALGIGSFSWFKFLAVDPYEKARIKAPQEFKDKKIVDVNGWHLAATEASLLTRE